MKRKLVTLHLDGKLLNQRTAALLKEVIDTAVEFPDSELSIGADKTVNIKVQADYYPREYTR